MIHFRKEAQLNKIGLNVYLCDGGFGLRWLWYKTETYSIYSWHFRFDWRYKPRILWVVREYSVIDECLLSFDLELVSKQTMEDVKGVR